MANVLNTERSTFLEPGPIKKFRGVFPYVRSAGIENFVGSKYIAIFSACDRSVGKFGSPDTFARDVLNENIVSRPLDTVNGVPAASVMMPLTCHPPSTAFAAPAFGAGISQTTDVTSRCRWSLFPKLQVSSG